MDHETLGKIADATKALADTGGKIVDEVSEFLQILRGPFRNFMGYYDDKLQYRRWKNQILLLQSAEQLMRARGLLKLTREIPLKFGVRLLENASLEEDDELRATWARLLVNAGDASTETDLRNAFIEILAGMSAFDVRNLSEMAKAALVSQPGPRRPVITTNLPLSCELYSGSLRDMPEISEDLGLSLANLARLGCAVPGGGLDGAAVYFVMTVTDLGLALYKACS